jgi:hypothetical protein
VDKESSKNLTVLMTTAARSSDPYPAAHAREWNQHRSAETSQAGNCGSSDFTGAVEAEEDCEGQEDGAEHQRRHGGRHAAAAALGRRRRRRQRR